MKITEFNGSYKSRFKFAPVQYGMEHDTYGIKEGENNTNPLGNATLPDGDQGINEQDIDKEVVKLRPDATPLDTIMRNMPMKSAPATSQEIKFYQQSNKPFFDTIDASVHGTGASAASPASSNTASGNGLKEIYIQVSEGRTWRPKDTLLMRGLSVEANGAGKLVIGGGTTITYDQMFYVKEKSGAVLCIVPIGGMVGAGANADTYIVPTFNASAKLFRMGSAMAEKDLTTEPFGIQPTPSFNYLQYFMCQVEQTVFEKMTNKEIAYDLTDQEADAIYNMRAEIESSYLWGVKYFFDGPDGRTYFTEGIARQIENAGRVFEYGTGAGDTTLTADEVFNLLQYVFTRNSGSKERVMFAGSEFIKSLELFMWTSAAKNMELKSENSVYMGVECNKIFNSFGKLNVIHHPMFDETEREAEFLIFDPQFIKKKVFQPMKASDIDFKSNGIKNVDAKVLSEVSGLTVRYLECHCVGRPRQ